MAVICIGANASGSAELITRADIDIAGNPRPVWITLAITVRTCTYVLSIGYAVIAQWTSTAKI